MSKEYIDLFELQTHLKTGVEGVFPSSVWVKAELSSVKARYGGHCYLELSQTGENGLVAKVKAVIWASKFRLLGPYFESVTGSALAEGMQVLLEVQVSYSQLYGLTLVVNNIDVEVVLGERELIRQQTIATLKEQGMMEMQAELAVPALPYNIAVISAADAAGFRDFERHLHENEYGFVFNTMLFAATMQGADAPSSIVAAMENVVSSGVPVDMVLILRGGGSKLDLSCFDDYSLAAHIATYEHPVFTAIGHDQDVSVCDMVSCVSVKTPTALAEEILDMYIAEDSRISSFSTRLKLAFVNKLNIMEGRVNVLETRIYSADPRNILKRGYVLALDSSGVPMKSVKGREKGDKMTLMFSDGSVDCEIINIKS